jgi:hypothetical protein
MLPSRWTSNGLSQIMATRPGAWDYSFEGAGVQWSETLDARIGAG